METRINCEKYTFWVIKSFKQLKNFGRVPYLGLELTIQYMSSKTKSISWDSPFKEINRKTKQIVNDYSRHFFLVIYFII